MSTDRDLTRIVRAWLEESANVLPDRVLDEVLAQLPMTPQRRPLWRAWRKRFMHGSFRFAMAGVAVIALALAGYSLFQLSFGPSASPPETPTPTPTEVVGPNGLVAYPVCTAEPLQCRIWVVNADGTGARELLPDVPGHLYPLAWSPDGSRLLYNWNDQPDGLHTGLALTDAAGSQPAEYESLCPVEADDGALNCGAELGSASFSPDGTRLTYTISEATGSGSSQVTTSAVVILDLSTGQVTKLGSTDATQPSGRCGIGADKGYNTSPSWSPDGTRVLFVRFGMGLTDGVCEAAVLTVNVDGGNLGEVVPRSRLHPLNASWSPGGSSILFHASPSINAETDDIYTVRPDGLGLQALTSDGVSAWPNWTRDGRIVFIRWTSRPATGPIGDGLGELWIMDADGTNRVQLEATIPALTAAGCIVCPYPIRQNQFVEAWLVNQGLWQPVPVAQP